MTSRDATVTDQMVEEAFSVIEDLDADDAIRWLGLAEPALAAKIRTVSRHVLERIVKRDCTCPWLIQHQAIRRAVSNTAVATATALMEGHHSLWLNLVDSPLAAALDPWVGVRREVIVVDIEQSLKAEKKGTRRRQESTPDSTRVKAAKLCITACVAAEDRSVSPPRSVLLLTSTAADRSVRHETVLQRDGEVLLRALVHGLARMGSSAAIAAWQVVCGDDATLDPPQPPTRRQRPDAREDDE